jgi:hypothetical protein
VRARRQVRRRARSQGAAASTMKPPPSGGEGLTIRTLRFCVEGCRGTFEQVFPLVGLLHEFHDLGFGLPVDLDSCGLR